MEQEQTPLPFTPHEAWGHMREALDREMPVKKRRRRFIFWLLPLMLTGVVFIWQIRYAGDKTANKANNLPGKSLPASTAPGAPAQNTRTGQPAAALPNNHQQLTTVKEKEGPLQSSSTQPAGGYGHSGTVLHGPRLQQHLQRVTLNKVPVFRQPARWEPVSPDEIIMMRYDSTSETATVMAQDLSNKAYSLSVPHPLLLNTAELPRLAEISTPFLNSNLPVKPAPVKAGLRPPPFCFGIRSGLVLNHAGWIRNKQPLFPQRLTPLELFIEKSVGKKYSAELSVNLFSSRNIQYGLRKQESGTDAAGNYHLRDQRHTAQALHFADIQLLLQRNLSNNWRLHGGVYFSVLKNIAVEVNNYDSTARPTATGHSFISTTETGYTYARKINSVDLVSPFRKTDIGLLAGFSYRKKQWQAGITAQAGLPRLYKPAAGATTNGAARTLQLRLWLGLRLKR